MTGNEFKRYRQRKGYSKVKAARKLKVSRGQINDWEYRGVKPAKARVIKHILR